MLVTTQSIGEDAVLQWALRFLETSGIHDPLRRDVAIALEVSRPGTLQLSYEAGIDAGLGHEELLVRAAAIYFLSSAVNVGDDLSDGDCTYFDEPRKTGPCVQAILRNLFTKLVLDAGVSPSGLSLAVGDLLAAIDAQRLELATSQWNADGYKRVAGGIGGRLFAAYFRVLWDGTPLAHRAPLVGDNIGRMLIVAEDVSSKDRRYTSLPPEDQRSVVAWAWTAVRRLRAERLRSIEFLLRPIEPVLRAACPTRGRRVGGPGAR